MSKNLLSVFALALTVVVNAQTGKIANPSSLNVTIPQSENLRTVAASTTVLLSPFAGTNTSLGLNTAATDTSVPGCSPKAGYVFGSNCYDDLEKAQFFASSTYSAISSPSLVGAVVYLYRNNALNVGVTNSTTPQTALKFYSATNNVTAPGALIAQKTESLSTVVAAQTSTSNVFTFTFTLASPVSISSAFYASIVTPTLAGDTMVMYAQTGTLAPVNNAWEKWDNGSWNNMQGAWGATFKGNIAIFPIISGQTAPCTASVASFTTCAGTSVTLTANGANQGTTYTWSPSASNASFVVVSPTATAVYTLATTDGSLCPIQTSTVTIASNLAVSIAASSTTLCAGKSATLTASSAATSYTWSTLANGSSIVVTPTANTTYSVLGVNGACFGTNNVAITVNPLPSITATTSASLACTGSTVIIGAQGGTSYVWALGSQTTVVNPVALTTGTTAGVVNLIVTGSNAAGCSASLAVTQSISLCTGINESSNVTLNALVYPNPFTNEINVTGVKGSLEIVNMLGQVVLTTSVNENEKINTINFAKGVYFVKVRNEQGVEVKTTKLVKN